MNGTKCERLAAKVAAVNKAGTHANALHYQLTEIFREWVGEKVEKQDGQLLAKVAKCVPELPCTPGLNIYRHSSNYSLAWTVSASETVNGLSTYHSITVYIGELRNGVLTALTELRPVHRTDYTSEEIETKRETWRQAKKIADEAHSNLYPFGDSAF